MTRSWALFLTVLIYIWWFLDFWSAWEFNKPVWNHWQFFTFWWDFLDFDNFWWFLSFDSFVVVKWYRGRYLIRFVLILKMALEIFFWAATAPSILMWNKRLKNLWNSASNQNSFQIFDVEFSFLTKFCQVKFWYYLVILSRNGNDLDDVIF